MSESQPNTGWLGRQRVIRYSWRGVALRTVLVLVGLAVLGAAGFLARGRLLTAVGRQLVSEDPLQPADAMVVLSGGTPMRELEAADLYKAGIAPVILLPHDPERQGFGQMRSRGMTVESDFDLGRRIFHEEGVPDAAVVVIDPVVESTIQEATEVVAWARAHHLHSLLVVTSAFHTARARFVYRHVSAGSGVAVRLRAARGDTFRPETWWRSRSGLRDGLLEWEKTIYYRLRY